MLIEYIHAAMKAAEYEILEDGTFYGHIPACQGVWANAPKLEACRSELQEVLEDWILIRTRLRLDLPVIDSLDINPRPDQADKMQEVA